MAINVASRMNGRNVMAGMFGKAAGAAGCAMLTLAASGAALAQPEAVPPGFVSLFDGKTLEGWKGDPAFWSVRDGVIDGGSDEPISANTFLISEQSFGNFELRFKYRFVTDAGNSGFHFRSGITSEKEHYLTGYQANVVPQSVAAERIGMLYEEIGRKEVAMMTERAIITRRRADQHGNYEIVKEVTGHTNPIAAITATLRPFPQWNEYVVIAYDNRIFSAINGFLTLDVTDNDPVAARSGVFGLQVHFGPAGHVQYKDIVVKKLASPPEIEGRFRSSPTALSPSRRSAVATTTLARDLAPHE